MPVLWRRAQVLPLVQALQMQLALMPPEQPQPPPEPVPHQLQGLEPQEPLALLPLLAFRVWLLAQ